MTINVLDLEDYVRKLERLQGLNNILYAAGCADANEGILVSEDIIGYSLAFSEILDPIISSLNELVAKGCAILSEDKDAKKGCANNGK